MVVISPVVFATRGDRLHLGVQTELRSCGFSGRKLLFTVGEICLVWQQSCQEIFSCVNKQRSGPLALAPIADRSYLVCLICS